MTEAVDSDILVLRRVMAAANRALDHWLNGTYDTTPYFQAGLAELKQCRKEGLIW